MIVCGKCGFTQPKDVYCANCGVNLEKYRPEKPPKLVQLAKDPYFQISTAIICAIAAFFIFINKPEPTYLDETSTADDTEVIVEEKTTDNKLESKKITKAAIPKQKNKLLSKKLFKKKPIKTNAVADKKIVNNKITNQKTETSNETKKVTESINQAALNYYELTPGQLEKYFPGTSGRVQASVIDRSEINVQNFSSSKLPSEIIAQISSKRFSLDYMIESLEDGELRGIKFTLKKVNTNSEGQDNINIKVDADIPSKEGNGASIDWSRTLAIDSSKTLLLKIALPHIELPASFMEDTYNSPLSIMSSPQFLDQKTQLLVVILFEN